MTGASARRATSLDIPALVALYHELAAEMVQLKSIWPSTDGLPEPVEDALEDHLARSSDTVYVGEIDDVPFGFLIWREEPLLPQAAGRSIAVIRHIFTTSEARNVGVGEAMTELFLAEARERGIGLFDAIVPPGHRHAKNFFESNGFKARRIVMHREDRQEATDVE